MENGLPTFVTRIISLVVTAGLIYLYFWWRGRKKSKGSKVAKVIEKIKPEEEKNSASVAAKMFWVPFYFLVGLALIIGGIYIITHDHDAWGYLIGGLILGALMLYQAYSVVVMPNKKK